MKASKHEDVYSEEEIMIIMAQSFEGRETTRYPVIDKDQCLGFINTKEMLTDVAAGEYEEINVLVEMQKSHIHIAIVVTEQDRTLGLVTMEDILEEIVGEIRDESNH